MKKHNTDTADKWPWYESCYGILGIILGIFLSIVGVSYIFSLIARYIHTTYGG